MDSFNIPEDLEERITKLENRADEIMPGDYSLRLRMARDGDSSLEAYHTVIPVGEERHEIVINEEFDEVIVQKNPFDRVEGEKAERIKERDMETVSDVWHEQ